MVIRRGRTNIFKVSSFFRQPLFYGFDVSKGILKEISLMREELAEKTGTKKSYISRIERGSSDIQISTYYKLIEIGLGKQLNIFIG